LNLEKNEFNIPTDKQHSVCAHTLCSSDRRVQIQWQFKMLGFVHDENMTTFVTCKTRSAWQSIACSPLGIAVSSLVNSSEYWLPQCLAVLPSSELKLNYPECWSVPAIHSWAL